MIDNVIVGMHPDSTSLDMSSEARTATVTGGVSLDSGTVMASNGDNSLLFDQSDQPIIFANDDHMNNMKNFTAVWISNINAPTVEDEKHPFIARRPASESAGDWIVFMYKGVSARKIYFYYWCAGGDPIGGTSYVASGTQLQDDTEQLWSLTLNYTNSLVYLYLSLNGTVVKESNNDDCSNTQPSSDADLYIGGSEYSVENYNGMKDNMQAIYLINKSLPSQSIKNAFIDGDSFLELIISADTTPPTIDSIVISDTTPLDTETIQVNVTATDTGDATPALDSFWLADNRSGVMLNFTSVNTSKAETTETAMFNFTAQFGDIQVIATVNDTSGNVIQSDLGGTNIVKSIMNVAATNGTDLNILEQEATTNYGTSTQFYLGHLDSSAQDTAGLLNLTMLTKGVIPPSSTINSFKIEYYLLTLQNGATTNKIRAYPIKTNWEEGTDHWTSFNSGGVNQTDWNGSLDLIDSYFPATPVVSNYFNISINVENYAQKLFDGTLGVWDEGLYLRTFFEPSNSQYSRLMSSDVATANQRPSYFIDYTTPISNTYSATAGDTSAPVADSVSINNTAPNIDEDIQTSVNLTEGTGISSVFQADNLSGVFLNKTSINLSEPSTQIELNYSTNFTNTLRFGDVVQVVYTFNDTFGKSGQAFLNYTVTDTIAPTADSISINNTAPVINEDVQASANFTDLDNINSIFFAHNMSGLDENISSINISATNQVELNASFNFTNTLARNNYVIITLTANDSNGNSVQTFLNYTVGVSSLENPTIIKPTEGTLYNVQPLHFNITYPAIADGDPVTLVEWHVNDTLAPNQSITVGGGNNGNTTFNASDGKYNISVSYCTDFACSGNTTITSFKIDTVNPLINLLTIMPNLTLTGVDVNFTIEASDTNLEGFNVTVFKGDDISGEHYFSTEITGITDTTQTIKVEINTSWGDGRYTITANASDDHTAKKIGNYVTGKDESKLEISFDTTEKGANQINQKLKSSDIAVLDFYTFKASSGDRYIMVWNFSNTSVTGENHTYVFETNAKDDDLIYRENSKYPSHFVSKDNWIDYALDTEYPIEYGVVETKEGNFETTITTRETTLIFHSIGGVNRIGALTQLEIDLTNATFHSLNVSVDGIRANNTFVSETQLNFTFNVSDMNPANVTFYVQDTKNDSSGYQNITFKNLTVPITEDGNYSVLMEINDSAGNKFNSTSMNVVVDTALPTINNQLNRTTGGSINIYDTTAVNISFSLGDIYIKNINISHNASSGNWINHTITPDGNSTYSLIIQSSNLSVGEVVGWNGNSCDLAGNCQELVHTFSVQAPQQQESTEGGSGGFTSGAEAGVTIFASQSSFSTKDECEGQGFIYHDSTCFHCTGILVDVDGETLCKTCSIGYSLDGNNNCVFNLNAQLQSILPKNLLDNTLNKFFPDNPLLGLIVVGVFGVFGFSLYSNRRKIFGK